MSKSIVRQSKYRHVFGKPAKQDNCFTALKPIENRTDACFCAANGKFVAYSIQSGGGGAFQVLPVTQTGRLSTKQANFTGHKSTVLDFAFSPFDDNLLATCSEDGEVKLWLIPDEGIKAEQNTPEITLSRHTKRVNLLRWHPVAENILLTAGCDNRICVWNIEIGDTVNVIDAPEMPYDVCWNHNGTAFAVTTKDKALRVYDARSSELLHV
uniref:Coronin n=1 Tax=Ciona intestinalis TaxID=7719 RepID=H2Y0Y4_CIOIN